MSVEDLREPASLRQPLPSNGDLMAGRPVNGFPRPFEVRSESIDGRVRRIAICGELDQATTPHLEAAVKSEFKEQVVVFDLSECSFMDSTGVALIVSTWQSLADVDGRRFCLSGAAAQVERLLDLTGVTGSVAVYPTLDQASRGVR